MRLIERLLLVVGATALGMAVCGPVLVVIAAATVFRTRPGAEPGLDWGSALGALGCGLCGGVAGAAIGFTWTVRRVAGDPVRPWTAATWVGVAIGLAAAAGVRFSGLLSGHLFADLIRWWAGAVIFFVAAGTLGGLIGAGVGRWVRRAAAPSGRAAKRPLRRDRKRDSGGPSKW